MVAKDLEVQKSTESNKEEDKEKIRSYVISIVKKDTPNISNYAANASALSETSNATYPTTSIPASKSILKRA